MYMRKALARDYYLYKLSSEVDLSRTIVRAANAKQGHKSQTAKIIKFFFIFFLFFSNIRIVTHKQMALSL